MHFFTEPLPFAIFPADGSKITEFAGKCNGNRLALTGSMAWRKNPHAKALGRLGGLKGGKARAEKLSARRRREIAQQAAIARWKSARKILTVMAP
jgi:hypothetical protein